MQNKLITMKTNHLALIFISLVIQQVCFASVVNKAYDSSAPIESIANLTSLKAKQQNKLSTPNIIEFKTNKNIKVLFVPNTTLPIVDISITFNAGSARDKEISKKNHTNLQGTANLVASLLTKGYQTKNGIKNVEDIASLLEDNGIQLQSSAYKDMFIVSSRSLSAPKLLTTTTDLINASINFSNFPTNQIDLTKNRLLLALKQRNDRPRTIASNAFMKALYGQHPYALPTSGSIESVKNINQKHLLDFRHTYLVAKNANIAITGNLSLKQAKQVANSITKDLPIGKQARKIPRPKKPKAKHIHIDFDSNQTFFMAGQIGISRKESKIHELSIANQILGGGDFSALLMQELRKKKGYTYGAYSSFTPMQAKGPFIIQFSARNEVASDALKTMKKIVKNYHKNGATQQQIIASKESLVNQFPLNLTSNAQINRSLAMMGFYNLPKDYLANHTLDTLAPTKHAINTAFKRKIDPKRMIIVTVGQQKP